MSCCWGDTPQQVAEALSISEDLARRRRRALGLPSPPAPRRVGQRFGRLVVLGRDLVRSQRESRLYLRCRCSCGKMISVVQTNLFGGHCRSCGCLRRDRSRASYLLHILRREVRYFGSRSGLVLCFGPAVA